MILDLSCCTVASMTLLGREMYSRNFMLPALSSANMKRAASLQLYFQLVAKTGFAA